MAVVLDANDEDVRRTANLPTSTAWTQACWFYSVSTPGSNSTMMAMENATTSAGVAYQMQLQTTLVPRLLAPGISTSNTFTTISNTTWYGIALTGSGTTLTAYMLYPDGTFESVSGTRTTDQTPALLVWGSNSYGESVRCRLANMKLYDAALTSAEVLAELMRYVPTRTDNINVWAPAVDLGSNRVLDFSGNARNLTETGTLTDGDGPPIPWGASPVLIGNVTVTYSFARPTSDITTNWTPSTGTDHYALIDETTASDTDYIYATAASQTDEVKLGALTAPTGDVSIRYRVQGVAASGRVTVSMYQGATLIKSDTQRTANGDYTMTVTSTDYASVTDWSDIRLRFVSG